MSRPATQHVAHPRDLEDVELRDLSTSLTPAAPTLGNTIEQQPPPVGTSLDADLEVDLDPISSSYLSILQHYGKTKKQGDEYQLLLASLCPRPEDDEGRCRVLVADLRRHDTPTLIQCQDSQRLGELFDNSNSSETDSTRLVLVEDLSLKHICVVGSRLKIHPSVFARHFIHLRFTSLHSDNMAASFATNSPEPPSGTVAQTPRYFTLRYFDVLPKDPDSYSKESRIQPWLRRHKGFPNYDFAFFNVLRRVFIPSKNGDWDVDGEVVTVQSKLSVWKDPSSKKTVILVDPTIRDLGRVQQPNGSASLETTSLRINFADIPPRPLTVPFDLEQLETPPAVSPSLNLFDDIQNTLSSSPWDAESDAPVEPLMLFLQQYVINKWITYLNHVHRCLVSVRDKQSVRSMQPDGGWSEDMFLGLKYWSEFLPMVQLTIEANMAALGIMDPFDDRSTPSASGLNRPEAREARMWRYVHRMLGNYAKMFERVADSYSQVVAIKEAQSSTIQAQASATQAQFVGRLTFLGTLFLPASLVAGVLSMGGEFLPGERLFWVYIVVLIPVLLLVILVLFTDLGINFMPSASFIDVKN